MRRVVLASCLVFGFVATNSLAWSPTTPEIAVAKFAGPSYAMTVDSSGNIYTTGTFQGFDRDFDPGVGTTKLEALGLDVFILKLDSRGELTWVKQFGDWGGSQAHSVAVDSVGNVYTTGFFDTTTDFDPGAGTVTLTSLGSQDVFVSKLNSAGEFVWAKQFGDVGSDQGRSVAVDSSGNVYTTGVFEGTVDFDPGAGIANLTSAGNSDVFVSKLDSNGAFVWAKRLGGPNSEDSKSVAVDSSGNVHTTGYSSGTADFDPGEGIFELRTPNAFQRAFVSKLDSNGAFLWAKQFDGTGGFTASEGWSVAVDSSGNVYSTGHFEGTEDFDPGAGNANLTSAGNSDVFVSKLNSNGTFVWAKRLGGAIGGEIAKSVAVDSSGNVYTGGRFSGTADFDPGDRTFNLTSEVNNHFVSKLDSTGAFLWAKTFASANQTGDAVRVVVDSSGNVYTTASFEGTVDFDPDAGTVNLTSVNNAESFVSKLSSAGAAVSATTTTTSNTTTTPAQAEEARRLAESRNAFELSERCRKFNHAFNDCPLWPGNVTTSTTTTTTSTTTTSTTTPATSSTTSTTTPATTSTTTTPATSSTTSTTTPLKNSTPTTSPTVLTKQSLSLKVSFAQLSRRLSKPAQTNLQLLVNRLNQASNISITCSGTMTLSEIQNSKSLARNRATTVCAKLRSLGLKATFNTTSNPISKLTKNQGRFVVVAATYSSD